MAVFNGSHYIAASIQSILNQAFSDFELLMVNDGSTDDTISIVKSFDDSRIRLLNQGLTYTRNRDLRKPGGNISL
jgi:glycosyltransferase involved in cell wall biosynthesis